MPEIGKYGGYCASNHRAFLYDRGGRKKIAEIDDLSIVQWERARDTISEAFVRIEGVACSRQRKLIQDARTKRHELKIFREGSSRAVWEGPLWRISDLGPAAELYAKDVSAYLFATMVTQRYDASSVSIEATTRLANMAIAELAAWGWESTSPPANVAPYVVARHSTGEAKTTSVVEPYSMTVGQHWQSLARTGGVDFAAVGRSLIVWDVSSNLGITRTLTEADFLGNIIATEYGADLALDAYVAGQEGLYGQAHVSDPKLRAYYGPWAMVFTNYSEAGAASPTQAELNSQAARNLTGRAPAPIEIRVPDSATLILSDDLKIDQITPGVHMPLRATINARSYQQMQKLDRVVVRETGDDGETVQVTLSPATKPDTTS